MEGYLMEIERAFIIYDSEHLASLIKTIKKMGFILSYSASQLNYYLDFPNFLLFNNKQNFRFRYNFKIEYTHFQDIKSTGEFVDGEISLSKIMFDKYSQNEIREQISIKMTDKPQLELFFELMGKVGFINSYFLMKDRELYTFSGKLPDNNEIHFEIDTNIKIGKYPKTEDLIHLQDTFQICIETENIKEYNNEKFNQIMNKLEFTPDEILKSKDYKERMEERIKEIKGEN